MKTIVKILSVGLLAAACQQFYVDTQMTPDQAVAKLECDALETYTIQGDKPQAVSFKVASTTPWTITGYEKAEWLKVSPVSSAFSSLSEDIVINAVANPNYQDRSATLTLSSEGTDTTYKIVINQTRKGKLFVQGVIDVFEAEGNTLPFTIETNLAWEVRSDEQWLSFDKNSGVGDGTVQTINATAAANASVSRKATVTVSAGEDKVSFEVNQKGQSLEFLPVEEPVIDRMGGTLELGVKTTMNWVVECDNSDFTVVKEADKVVVSAPFNNKFKARTAVITIKPASGDFGDVSSTVEVSQDCNFELSGGCEVLEDGSVKFSASSDKPRVTTKDRIRYASIVLTMGDVHFGDKGHLCLSTHDAGLTGNSEIKEVVGSRKVVYLEGRSSGSVAAGGSEGDRERILDDAHLGHLGIHLDAINTGLDLERVVGAITVECDTSISVGYPSIIVLGSEAETSDVIPNAILVNLLGQAEVAVSGIGIGIIIASLEVNVDVVLLAVKGELGT